jgi:hypothetical protein
MVAAGSADHRTVSTQGTPSAVRMQCMLWRTLHRCDGHPLDRLRSIAGDGAWTGRRLHSFEGFIMGHAQPSGIDCAGARNHAAAARSCRRGFTCKCTTRCRSPPRGLRSLFDAPAVPKAPAQMWAGVSPVPAQMWQRGEPSPRADAAGVSPVPVQMRQEGERSPSAVPRIGCNARLVRRAQPAGRAARRTESGFRLTCTDGRTAGPCGTRVCKSFARRRVRTAQRRRRRRDDRMCAECTRTRPAAVSGP